MDETLHRKENGIENSGMWMCVEFLGHNKLFGFVTEEQKWGQVLLRIDIPTIVDDSTGKMHFTTQWYGTHALYCATPVSETDAIHLAKQYRPKPFDKFDLNRESNMNLDNYRIVKDDNDIPF